MAKKLTPAPSALAAPAFRAYLIALGERHADPVRGFFGPDSVSWRINQEAVLVLGGMRALLMQVAHPKVAQGVADHSRFRQAPLARALRTLRAVHGMVFGAPETAIDHAVRVHAIHERIRGSVAEPLPPGTEATYCANDPELLRWVFATLMDSAITTYELFFTPLDPPIKERAYAEGKLFAQLFGLEEAFLPATWGDFQRWLRETIASPGITVTPAAREIARALLSGSLALRVLRPVNSTLAAGMLAPKLREGFGLRWNPAVRAGFTLSISVIRLLARLLPDRLRRLPIARQALKRCQRSLSPSALSCGRER